MKTWVYKHMDAYGRVLYIGVSNSPTMRTETHSKNSFWFKDVRSISLTPYETREKALLAEAEAIIFYNPPHNNVCIMNGKVIKSNWQDKCRTRFSLLKPKTLEEISRVGIKSFAAKALLTESTVNKIVADSGAFLTNGTMDKIDLYFSLVTK